MMKKATLLTTITLLLLAGLSYAVIVLLPMANEKVTGQITDAKTGEPIMGATVVAYIDKENKGAVATDADGNYTLNLPAGTYAIETKYIGYKTQKINGIIVAAGKTTKLDFKLNAEDVKLSEVIVTDYDGGKDEAAPALDGARSYDMEAPAPPAGSTGGSTIISGEGKGTYVGPTAVISASSPSREISTTDVKVDVARYSVIESKSVVSKSAGKASDYKTKTADKTSIKGKSTRFEKAETGKKDDATVKVDETKKDVKIEKEIVKEPDTRAGQLTAGEWSDNRNWDFFIGLRKKDDWKGMESLWGFNFGNRYTVKVVSGGKPQNDVPVILKDKKGKVVFEGRSDNNGMCYLFAGLIDKDDNGATIEVKSDGGTKSVDAGDAGAMRPTTIEIARSKRPANKVDIMFTIDATGSMGDEMNYLKEELSDVVRRVKASSEQMVDVRLSANVYRDHGDEYVVRPFPFTTDVSSLLTNLSAQYAGGGGDFEEAVEEGLDDAINKHEWSDDATARILFLVLDAPPHNTPENKAKIYKAALNAAKKGIRIVPITSSGINKETEFLMRYLAAATGGTYVFLTDHSGIGGSHIEPTIGKYDVEYLNNLMVRLIQAYLTTES